MVFHFEQIKKNGMVLFCLAMIIIIIIESSILIINIIEVKEDRIDLNNTSCKLTKYLGRQIYFHVCEKNLKNVYDIRYFWTKEKGVIKPEIIGVQLTEMEFDILCKQC